jgi:hypothetical protein
MSGHAHNRPWHVTTREQAVAYVRTREQQTVAYVRTREKQTVANVTTREQQTVAYVRTWYRIFRKWEVWMWTVSGWLRIGTVGGQL